jgi:glycerol uptake operon antiterminator
VDNRANIEWRRTLNFLKVLQKRPVIAAFRKIEKIRIQDLDNVDVIFILGGSIFDLPQVVKLARTYQKIVFVDIDLLKGIGKDAEGIRFLAKESRVDGIITTRGNLIKNIKQEGLFSIQRIFILDSESLAGALNSIKKSNPDAVDILPGLILPKIAKTIRAITSVPLISGGLITREEDIREILAAGAIGISTTENHLFNFPAKG